MKPSDEELQRRQESWQIYKYRPIRPTPDHPYYNNCLGFHQSRAKVRLIMGANRSSKTETMLAELAALCICEDLPPWWFNWESFPKKPLTIWLVLPQFPKNWKEDARFKKLYFGENYLTRDGRWVWKAPLIPPEMIHWHNADWTEVVTKNGNTISVKSSEQSDLAFASNQVDGIFIDEPTETNKWGELISRMIAVPHARLIHGLTDAYDTTEYLDEMIDSEDPELDFEKFDFTTAGNPHTDIKHAQKVFKFQTKEQRQVREMGLRPRDLALCYPKVFKWFDDASGRIIQNVDGGTGNWIKPFKIPFDWTRYVIHDPGVNVSATVWFAVEPGKNNIYAYKCVHHKNPGGNFRYVVDMIHRHNNGDEIQTWYMDPKAAAHTHRSYVFAAKESAIKTYRRYSEQFGIRWLEGPPQLANDARFSRIRCLTSYLDPLDKSVPMMYFFDVKDGIDPDRGLEGMPGLKYELKKYKIDPKTHKPVKGHDDAIYCCEAAAYIPLRWRGKTAGGGNWSRIRRPDPVAEFMNGNKPMNWREEP